MVTMAQLQKPFRGAVLNLAHPLARGLEMAYIFNEGVGLSVFDQVRKVSSGMTNTPVWEGGERGPTLRFNGSDESISTGLFKDIPVLTAIVKFKADANPGTAAYFDSPMHARYNFFFSWGHSQEAHRNGFGFNDGTTWRTTRFTNALGGVDYVWAGTIDRNFDMRLYANGEFDALGTQATAAPATDTGNDIEIGKNTAGAYYFAGTVEYGFVWSRVLSAEEIRQMYREPYVMFSRPRYYSIGGETHQLAGTVAGVSALTGAINKTAALAGLSAAVSALTGNLTATLALAGQVDGVSALTGILRKIRSLAGQISGESSLSGAIGVTKELAGIVEALSGVSGGIDVTKALAGQIAGESSLSGSVQLTKALAGAIEAVSALTGTLSVAGAGEIKALAGVINAISSLSGTLSVAEIIEVTGKLTKIIELTGSLKKEAIVTGGFTKEIELAGRLRK